MKQSSKTFFFLMNQASKATEIGLVFDGKKLDMEFAGNITGNR